MLWNFLIPIILSCFGAYLGFLSGLPLGQLLGAIGFTMLACRFGLPLRMPSLFIIFIQLVLGISIGALINAELARGLTDLTVIAGLVICMTAQLVVGYNWLHKVEKWSRIESLLGAAPGAMAAVMTLTGEENKASGKIVFTHMVRTIVLLIAVFLITGSVEEGPAPNPLFQNAFYDYLAVLPIALGALAAGKFLERLAMPAPYMITGLVFAAATNLFLPVSEIVVPETLALFALALLGGLIGLRLKDITLRDTAGFLRAGLVVTLFTFTLTAGFAWAFSLLTQKTFLVLFMSWAPGGVEVMAATALLLGLEPAFVMLNHVLRMSILHISPMFLSRDIFRDPDGPSTSSEVPASGDSITSTPTSQNGEGHV